MNITAESPRVLVRVRAEIDPHGEICSSHFGVNDWAQRGDLSAVGIELCVVFSESMRLRRSQNLLAEHYDIRGEGRRDSTCEELIRKASRDHCSEKY